SGVQISGLRGGRSPRDRARAHDQLDSSGVLAAGRLPPLQHPARDLDSTGDREGDPEREEEPLPGRVLERVPTEVAEERGVERPAGCCGGVEEDEATPPKPQQPSAQSYRRSPARNEARDRDQLSAALGQLALRPFDPPPRLLAAEEAVDDARAEAPPDPVR